METAPQRLSGRPAAFRRALLRWYDAHKRDLPWRATTDFYPVWISEIMLQQTRVEAAVPYFGRFLPRFPDVESLAGASEDEVLTAWSGLGYYSRARNLHRAAKRVRDCGIPESYDEVRALPGVGAYTAAAIASIVSGLPHAAVDGNVLRVMSRVSGDDSDIGTAAARARLGAAAERLLDRRRPGDFNQALMELGATVCVPREPRCGACPVARQCVAKASGRERELPVKRGKPAAREAFLDVAVDLRRGKIRLVRRAASEKRMGGFWELPLIAEGLKGAGGIVAEFTHRVVNDAFRVRARKAAGGADGEYFGLEELCFLPVTTVTRKVLAALGAAGRKKRSAADESRVEPSDVR